MNIFLMVLKGLWMAVYYTVLWAGVLTALSWVVALLGLVAMFVAVVVPFGLVPPMLNWLLKSGVAATEKADGERGAPGREAQANPPVTASSPVG